MGWASGFQSGVQLGKAALEAEKRRALESIAKEQVQQQYTPEQGAEMERIAGLQTQNAAGEVVPQYQFTTTPGSTAYGLSQFNPETGGYDAIRQGGDNTPAYQVNPQTAFLGKYYDQPLSEDRVRGLRMRAMADAIAPYDPIEAQRLSANAAEQEHLAEMRPMQREKAGLELGAARRENVDAERMAKFDEWASANPELAGNFDEVAKKLREIGATTAQQFKVASNMTGIAESKFKANETEIKNKILGKSPDELLEMLKTDDKFEPGRHYVKRTDAKGKVITDAKGNFVVDMVDTATGALIQPNIFTGTNTQLGGFLSAAATSPAAVADYTMKYEKHQSDLKTAEQNRAESQAKAGYYNTGLRSANLVEVVDASGARTQLDRSKFMVGGKLELPKGYKLATQEKVERAPIHIDSQSGRVTQGDQVIGRMNDAAGTIEPYAPNPWKKDPKVAAEWEQKGVRQVPVQSASGKYVWGYTSGGDVYDRPEDAFVEIEQRRLPRPGGLNTQGTIPAPSSTPGRAVTIHTGGVNTAGGTYR
jgi:hypothetical protein